MNINSLIDEVSDEINAIRHYLHENPELSQQEKHTAEFVSKQLTELGIAHETNIAGYGIVGILHGKKEANHQVPRGVALRADMDALPIQEQTGLPYASKVPGVMHACGHDVHIAILLGAAMVLKKLEHTFSGSVKFFFQPAEETVGGAEGMIAAGYMEHPSIHATLGLHIQPELPSGTVNFFPGAMNAGTTEFSIVVEGISCHGANPDDGIDPIFVASSIVVALQSISSRRLAPTTPGIVTVGRFHSGTAHNIIPKDAEITGTIRALDKETMAFIKDKVREIATHTARAHGAVAHLTFGDSYPPLINNREVVSILESVAHTYLPQEQILVSTVPSMCADDFSYFSQAVPSAYFNLGTCPPGDCVPQHLHNEFLCPDDRAMKVGVLMEVMGTLALLNCQD